jgi:hypothetical protein
MGDDLKLWPIAPHTEAAHYACGRQLSEHYQRSPELVTAEEIRQYCIRLKQVKKVPRQTSTQAICAIKLFWEKTLDGSWPQELELFRANPQFKLPVVLSASEARRLLGSVAALEHRIGLTSPYRDSQTGQTQSIRLTPSELIRRFLQHVLPAGLRRVRLLGWFPPAAKVRGNRVRALLGQKPCLSEAERTGLASPRSLGTARIHRRCCPQPPTCTRCGQPLVHLGTLLAMRRPPQPCQPRAS